MSYLWLLRPVLSIAFAYLLVRKIRKPLYKVIVWFMPPQQRFAPGSFNTATKWVNIFGIALTVIVTGCLFWGFGKAADVLSAGFKTETESSQQKTPVMQPVHAPAPMAQPTEPKTTEQFQPNIPNLPSPRLPQDHYETPPPVPHPDPMTMPPARSSGPALFPDPHYVQVGAFTSLANAQQWARRLRLQIGRNEIWHRRSGPWIGFVGQDHSPYKVLLGPYPDRTTASQSLRSQPLKGFPRPAASIQYLME